MGRTIKEIYSQAVAERNKRLELKEFSSDSKLSVMNGILWVTSACIYSFEAIVDAFAVDVTTTINNRINGTPTYYANALLQYQQGDTVVVREDGLAYGYVSEDPLKRIITQVAYTENASGQGVDVDIVMKVATGEKGNLQAIPADELVAINAYLSRVKFAGTRIVAISRQGDVLIPRVTVYWDGSVRESELYDAIEESLHDYIVNIDFNSAVYVSKVLDAIKRVDHVTDVYVDPSATPAQGIFLACYDGDGLLSAPAKVHRMTHTSSGYVRQSTGKGDEKELPGFRQAITLKIDTGCDTDCLQTES